MTLQWSHASCTVDAEVLAVANTAVHALQSAASPSGWLTLY
jgi:hypothetical protein